MRKLPLLLAALTLGTAQPLWAGEPGSGHGGRLKEMLAKLNLTEEQRTKIKEIRESRGKSAKELRHSLHAARQEMREAMKGSASREDLLAKYESLEALRLKVARSRFQMVLDVRDVLTPEQRKEAVGLMDRHHPRMPPEED